MIIFLQPVLKKIIDFQFNSVVLPNEATTKEFNIRPFCFTFPKFKVTIMDKRDFQDYGEVSPQAKKKIDFKAKSSKHLTALFILLWI